MGKVSTELIYIWIEDYKNNSEIVSETEVGLKDQKGRKTPVEFEPNLALTGWVLPALLNPDT